MRIFASEYSHVCDYLAGRSTVATTRVTHQQIHRHAPKTHEPPFQRSVSRFQEKEKRGEMITINDNIK
jgi:hypothetical protein